MKRFTQTWKFECLDKFVVVGAKNLDHVSQVERCYCGHERPHSSRDRLPPDFTASREEWWTVRIIDITCSSKLGGVIHSYSRTVGLTIDIRQKNPNSRLRCYCLLRRFKLAKVGFCRYAAKAIILSSS
jgi:hypothetical protein